MENWIPFVQKCDDEGVETITTKDQLETEQLIEEREKNNFRVLRNNHRDYFLQLISGLPPAMSKLCSEEPWIPYWFLNSMHVLNLDKIPNFQFYEQSCINYINKRKSSKGGYASAPSQRGHIVLGYVSINSIALSQKVSNYETIDRKAVYEWIMSLKQPNGSFASESGCEADSRSTYCAICIAYLLDILTEELTANVAEFLVNCQGTDGGFAPIPGCESHGGYGFCSVAALDMLGRLSDIRLDHAIRWVAERQMPFSGGFNGRPCKLVDTCYTWWCGAMGRILADFAGIDDFWNDEALATYVLQVCQSNDGKGGCCDKPGKRPDMYHTMYGLTGLSAASRKIIKEKTGFELCEVDARVGIEKIAVDEMKEYFSKIPFSI
ncbi:Protein farnesyltransferase subunit beta [Tritrichomonas foetus]|uniref:Protein farnesyltransferase subunit beta n=1 Tax=Tritrichomonas foetus TaxID=1144522 RepID=A0A1J4JI94_9EUKA|nr:Protein farnesyltransferase subunit beta [Tritrichomonas foetus]|eukprot:OHS98854.1 Protein farnesyltransferase subunit beta [Tritrichomonas foetus]